MNDETASYYSLAEQDASGLCSGINVVIADVFFFPEFRNDELTDTAKITPYRRIGLDVMEGIWKEPELVQHDLSRLRGKTAEIDQVITAGLLLEGRMTR